MSSISNLVLFITNSPAHKGVALFVVFGIISTMAYKGRTYKIPIDAKTGKEGTLLAHFIHIYRWHFCFLKLAIDYEKIGLKVKNKLVKFKVDRTAYKGFNLKTLYDYPPIIKWDKGTITQRFDNFFKKHKHLYIEQTPTFVKSEKEDLELKDNYIFKIPNKLPQERVMQYIKRFYQQKRTADYRKLTRTELQSSTAKFKIVNAPLDLVLQKYFYCFVHKKLGDKTNLEIADVKEISFKGKNADYQKRSVQTYVERSKFIIFNTAKGLFFSIKYKP